VGVKQRSAAEIGAGVEPGGLLSRSLPQQRQQWRARPHGTGKRNGSLLDPPEAVGRVGVASPRGADIAAGADPEGLLTLWGAREQIGRASRPQGARRRNGSVQRPTPG